MSAMEEDTRETRDHYVDFHECRDKILAAMDKMTRLDHKKGRSPEMQELITEASLHIMKLRQTSRKAVEDEEHERVELEKLKVPVDKAVVELNNLLYEKNYYLKSIRACRNFKTEYPGIELVSQEHFFKHAPEELKGDPELLKTPRKLMLKRLAYEYMEREEIKLKREQLDAKVRALQSEVHKHRKLMDSLPGQLAALKQAAEPVARSLGHDKNRRRTHKQPSSAELLPTALYVLYRQLITYKETHTEPISVAIHGNVKEAEALASLEAATARMAATAAAAAAAAPPAPTAATPQADEETEPEESEEEEGSRKRPRRQQQQHAHHHSHNHHQTHHRQPFSIIKAPPYGTAKLAVPHPLTLELTLLETRSSSTQGGGSASAGSHGKGAPAAGPPLLVLKFEYLRNMKVVVVGVEGPRELAGDLSVLEGLFGSDTGVDTSTEASQLATEGVPGFSTTLGASSRPFKWAQQIAGLEPAEGDAQLASGVVQFRQQCRLRTVMQQLWQRARERRRLAAAQAQRPPQTEMHAPPVEQSKQIQMDSEAGGKGL